LFQTFKSVFHSDLTDPALFNAVMLTIAFAVKGPARGGGIDMECLGYQSKAVSAIRERISSFESATSLSTLGAILLLAGVEARLGMRVQVQLHMQAIRTLLERCSKAESVYLTDGIKRAIFW
jgi:hypothetical protein